MKIWIVIPLYNEDRHITYVIDAVAKHKLPIIVVDDGSQDKSRSQIAKLQKKYRNLKLLVHAINLGKGAAMKTGSDYAFENGADAVILMDSDNQHKASDLDKFIKSANSNNYDIILGSRKFGMKMPFVRFLGNKIASLVVRMLFGIYVSDILCGYRLITKKAYKIVRWNSAGYGVETEMLARAAKSKLRFVEIPVETIYHDVTKGVTILDSFGVLVEVFKWRLTL